MNVPGTSNYSASSSSGVSATKNSGEDVVQQFMDYMKESSAQRMEDAWLAAHGITRKQFDAMSGAEKQKIVKEMQQDIKQKLKQQAEDKAKSASGSIL